MKMENPCLPALHLRKCENQKTLGAVRVSVIPALTSVRMNSGGNPVQREAREQEITKMRN
jgi:hypothetical protein